MDRPSSSSAASASASSSLRDDEGVVLAAVARHGRALRFASRRLRACRAVALVAVAQDGTALAEAAPGLRRDRALVLAAVAQDGAALAHAPAALRSDRALVLEAVRTAGDAALRHASPALRADSGVVLAAVRHQGAALQSAAAPLRACRAVVLAAVAQDGLALRHACPTLQADPTVVMRALRQNGDALCWAAPAALVRTPHALVAAVAQAGLAALAWAPPEPPLSPAAGAPTAGCCSRRRIMEIEAYVTAGLAAALAFRTLLAGISVIRCPSRPSHRPKSQPSRRPDGCRPAGDAKNAPPNGQLPLDGAGDEASSIATSATPVYDAGKQGSFLLALNLDEATGSFIKRLVADFAGVPYGQALRDIRRADEKIRAASLAACASEAGTPSGPKPKRMRKGQGAKVT